MNEIPGRSAWAPTVFGTAAPDTGNAEIPAMFGTEAQRRTSLEPLLDGDIVSCFSMTEPQACADPGEFTCRAWRDGEEWVVDGETWFSSNARHASFLIVMAVTDPDAEPYERMSMFLVPADTLGVEIVRNVGALDERDELDEGAHACIRYHQVLVPLDHILGGPGEGFKVAQARLDGGRVHHAMQVVGECRRALDMLSERALSRRTQGRLLGDHQSVQGFIADSAIRLQQFRLLVIHTAWITDTQPHGAARMHIAMCKVALAQGPARHHPARTASARLARCDSRDAAGGVVVGGAPTRPGRRAYRAPQVHGRQADAEADFPRRDCGPASTSRAGGKPHGRSTPPYWKGTNSERSLLPLRQGRPRHRRKQGAGSRDGPRVRRCGRRRLITSRKIGSCQDLANELAARGRRALPVASRFGSWDGIDALVDQAYAEFGKVDVLVNAGVSPLASSSAETSEELFDKVVGVNFKGPYRLCATVGQRINVSSSGALRPGPHIGPYGV